MIGTGLKKLARSYNMQVSDGVAYGPLMGFATTLSEGAGWKRIDIATKFSTPEQKGTFLNATEQADVARTYQLQNMGISNRCISIIFQDTIGTMKRIEAFIQWFYPLLESHGAERAEVCSKCGSVVAENNWHLVDGVAYQLHENCAEQIRQELASAQQQREEADDGSYVQGLIGAVLGAALGAVVWALILSVGYVASLVGLLIGWLADKGYNLLHGKQGKGKVAILILAVVFGVAFGTLLGHGIALAQEIGGGGLPGVVYGDIPNMILSMLMVDSEYLSGTLLSIGQGLLFAGLGVYALLRKAGQEVASVKIKKLN